MKKFYYLPFVASLSLLGSCSSEAPDVVQGEEPENGEGYYMKVAFNTLQTRATTDPELQIENAAFVFYNQQGRRIATRYIGGQQGNAETADLEWVSEPGHPASKCAVLKLSSAPKYVSCVVNADDSWTFSGANEQAFRDLQSNTVKKSGKNVMIMSSTKYYQEKEGQDPTPVYLVEINREKMLHTTKEAATAAQGDAAVVIPVEPVAAKVAVSNGLELAEDGSINPQEGERVDQVDAVVTFTPELAFLTATNTHRFTVKRIPTKYTDIPEDIRTKWTVKVNEYANRRSNWVGETAGNVVYPILKNMITKDAEDATKVTVNAGYQYSSNPVFYPFDNIDDEAVYTTSVVVAGRYKLTDTAGNNLAAADGSFWLVAIGDKFKVYKTEADAIAAMGGVAGDVLEEDRENADSHLTWTGWMRIKGKTYLPKCMKYDGGFGYYSRAIPRAVINGVEYPAIVRNTLYNVSIKTINGMGIGIPGDDIEIIPLEPNDPKDENYYLHIAVDVKDWAVMNYNAEWQ
ncbi:MAG: fimbria major subunit [Muribaculaceae bacterium]|nr:fimbria major subunit [Muribaculaceae bacterium]